MTHSHDKVNAHTQHAEKLDKKALDEITKDIELSEKHQKHHEHELREELKSGVKNFEKVCDEEAREEKLNATK
jgi:hypothetical protein